MANEKVYVGEDGAKELYRRVKTIIPKVDTALNLASNNAISNSAVTEAFNGIHDTTYTAGDGLSLNDTVFKVTPGDADDGYFTTKSNHVVWVPDQFVEIITPDPASPERSLRIQFSDPNFDAEHYAWPEGTLSYSGKLKDATWVSQGNGVWDMVYDNSDWSNLFNNYNTTNFNDIPKFDVIGGNCNTVSSFKNAFNGCNLVTNFGGISHTDAVTDVQGMFYNASNIESIQLPDMDSLSTITLLSMQATKLKSIEIGNLPLCSRIDFLAAEAPVLESITLGDLPSITSVWYSTPSSTSQGYRSFNLYTPRPTSSSYASFETPTLKTIVLGDMNGLTDATGLFCRTNKNQYTNNTFDTAFRNVEAISIGATPNINVAEEMFYCCYSLNQLTMGTQSFSKITNASAMFSACKVLPSIPSIRFGNSLTNVYSTFAYCRMASSGILDMYNHLSGISGISDHRYTFRECGINSDTGAAELAQLPSGWKE